MIKHLNAHARTEEPRALDAIFDLLDQIGRISSETDDFKTWLMGFMKAICDYGDWKIGHAWAPCPDNPQELESLKIWHLQPGANADAFKAKTETLRFQTGIGLPGRVHQKKKFDWIPDVIKDDNYPRKPFAEEAGLIGGYGCPVMVRGNVEAVIEFYDSRPANPSPHLVRMLEYLGAQVAPVLERSRQAQKRIAMATELESKVAGSVKEISTAAQRMRQAAESASQLSGTARERSQTSAVASTRSTDQVKMVSEATAELLSSIRNIESELAGTRNTVTTAAERVTAANSTFESLSAGAQEIEEIISIINKIADKTKLLSLNATIEASRAGELGAGFAVVASEVKELAAQTEQSTNHIAQRVQEIQGFTAEAIDEFKTISDTIARIGELTNMVTSSMEQQQQTGVAISENSNAAADQSQSACLAVQDVAEQLTTIDDSARFVLETASHFVERLQDLQVEIGSFVNEIRQN